MREYIINFKNLINISSQHYRNKLIASLATSMCGIQHSHLDSEKNTAWLVVHLSTNLTVHKLFFK